MWAAFPRLQGGYIPFALEIRQSPAGTIAGLCWPVNSNCGPKKDTRGHLECGTGSILRRSNLLDPFLHDGIFPKAGRAQGDFQNLIRTTGTHTPGGEERIAAKLPLKHGLHLFPRTVCRYVAGGTGRGWPEGDSRRWVTFVRNHARALVNCDFWVAVTTTRRILDFFVAPEDGSRELVRVNVTSHPTAAWTLPQVQEVLAAPDASPFVLHDRDTVSSPGRAAAVTAMGVKALRTPLQTRQVTSYCERLLKPLPGVPLLSIPLGEEHLRRIPGTWQAPLHS